MYIFSEWRMYILPECIAVGNRLKKRRLKNRNRLKNRLKGRHLKDTTGIIRQEVNFFVELKFLIIR